MSGALDAVAGLDPAVLCLGAGVFTMAETSMFVGLLVPGDAVLVLAGASATSPVAFAAVVLSGLLGCLAGQSLGFFTGRRLGPRIARSWLGRRLGADRWARAEELLERGGGPAIAGSRFVPVVHALVPVIAGAVGMPYRRFIRWAALADVVWSALYAGIGAAAGASLRQGGGSALPLVFAGFGVLVGTVSLLRTVRRRRRRAEPVPEEMPAAAQEMCALEA